MNEKPCGCQHVAVAEGVLELAEPIYAIAEGRNINVVGGGHIAPTEETPPDIASIQFERLRRVHPGHGGWEPTLMHQRPVQQGDTPPLPWVRVARSPDRFRSCLKASRKLGAIDSSEKAYKLLKGELLTENQEIFVTVQLDAQFMVLGVTEIARGARDGVAVPVPDVLRVVLVEGAVSYFVAHNHPSGEVTPSEADKNLTKALALGSAATRVALLDHLVIGSDGYTSFAENPDLKPYLLVE
jgi:DNA repair protein RadC